ncbi:MAG: type II toxin-antitoxin system RelE/ParE family toxin [Pseudanabaena sp. ELA607]|jgi:mRNA interferase RelE/StbE
MSDRFTLQISRDAKKSLAELQPKQFKQIATKIFALLDNPQPQDCKALKGYAGGYRVDAGEYRVLYTIEGNAIRIFRVGKRNDDEVYRNL